MSEPVESREDQVRRAMSDRRVVVTGMGAITPSGNSVDALWRSVRDGHSAIRVLDGEEFADLPVRIGGQVRGFDASAHLPRALARRLSPVQQWAIAAADQAVAQATTPATAFPDPATLSSAAPASAAPTSATSEIGRAHV